MFQELIETMRITIMIIHSVTIISLFPAQAQVNTEQLKERIHFPLLNRIKSFSGIRSHHNTALFRITEADSDDDQSGESCPKSSDVTRQTSENTDLPLVKILPTPINGSRDIDKCPLELNISWENDQPNRLYDYNRLLEDDFRNSSDPFHLSVQNWEQPRNSTVMGYSQTLSRLKNETNESEVESSCSTRSTADDTFTPNKLISANFTTPESGIHTGPCTSSGSRSTISNLKSFDNLECSDEPEWVVKKHRQKVKRVRRNYRNHIGESDSN